MPGNYKLETNMNKHNLNIATYKYGSYGMAYKPAIACGGTAPPSHMSNIHLSENPIAIESQLFGLGSTNLVEKYKPEQARIKRLDVVSFFDRNTVVMPNKLVIEKYQRALPL